MSSAPAFRLLDTPLLLQAEVGDAGLSVTWSLVLLLVSIAGYALVNTIEIAVVGANRIRLRHLAEGGDKSALALQRLRSREDRFFAGIVVLQNLFVFVAASMASLLSVELAGGKGLIFATILMTGTIALFGEVTPKVIGAKASDRLALFFARPTELLILAMLPVTVAFSAAPNLLSQVFFRRPAGVTPTVSEAELRMLVDISVEEGAVGEAEAELIDRVFRFYDRRVNEIMVPRTEVTWVEAGTTLAQFYRIYNQASHSRFPVYKDSLDNVVGIINIKDVLRAVAQGRAADGTLVDGLMRRALFVPETKLVGELFVEMQEGRHQMAIAVDEFGGTAGIVTLELLLEEMVGRVTDELGRPEVEFRAIDERTIRVDGGMAVSEVREELGIDIPEGDYETIAGYILSELGHIPKEGEGVQGDGFRVTVATVKGRKIEEVVVTRLASDGASSGEPAAS